MSKINFTFLLLLLVSTSAGADYELMFTTRDNNKFFLDKDSIKRKNGFIYYKYMVNYNKRDPSGFLSEITIKQGQCSRSRTKDLSLIWFIKHNGKGKSFNTPASALEKNWEYLKKDTIGELILKIVCLPEKISR